MSGGLKMAPTVQNNKKTLNYRMEHIGIQITVNNISCTTRNIKREYTAECNIQ